VHRLVAPVGSVEGRGGNLSSLTLYGASEPRVIDEPVVGTTRTSSGPKNGSVRNRCKAKLVTAGRAALRLFGWAGFKPPQQTEQE
jgi:hypothetical protein